MHPVGRLCEQQGQHHAAASSSESPDVPAQPAPQPARPDTALADALARLAAHYDLRQLRRQAGDDADTAPVEVVEHAFCCDLPRLDCIAALREAWARLAFVALGQEQAGGGGGLLPVAIPVAVGDVPGVVTASLWPAPMTALSGRRATIAGLGRQAGAPSLWEVASGALIDATVPPGVVEVQFLATLELEFEPEPGAAEPGPAAQTPVCVAVFDLCAGPRGSHGRVRAVAACWPWLEQLIETAGLGAAWRWTDAGMGAPPAQPAATATAAPPEGAGQSAPPQGPQGPQTEGVRLPRRPAYRRRWQAAWRLIKPSVHAGQSDVKLLQLLRQHGLPRDVRFLRAVIAAGLAGLLD